MLDNREYIASVMMTVYFDEKIVLLWPIVCGYFLLISLLSFYLPVACLLALHLSDSF